MLFRQSGSGLKKLDKPKTMSRHGSTNSWGNHMKGATIEKVQKLLLSRSFQEQLDTSIKEGSLVAVGAVQPEVNSHSLPCTTSVNCTDLNICISMAGSPFCSCVF